MKKEKFLEIFEDSRKSAHDNEKAEIVSNNGTSESVLKHLRTLSDPVEMQKAVTELSDDMYETFKEVYKVED
ncbi:MAG TPA: hypothetical protein CFH84_03430 [Sulfurimonas sp. UBA12504]|nr:MAG TPA: hypothetical protein CFH84_03430 [Sulfurimonas sp. UBA12504]